MMYHSTCGRLKAVYHSLGKSYMYNGIIVKQHNIKVSYVHSAGGYITTVSETELYSGIKWIRKPYG